LCETVALLLICFTSFRPGYWLDLWAIVPKVLLIFGIVPVFRKN